MLYLSIIELGSGCHKIGSHMIEVPRFADIPSRRDCPHCLTVRAGFTGSFAQTGRWMMYVWFCNVCDWPVVEVCFPELEDTIILPGAQSKHYPAWMDELSGFNIVAYPAQGAAKKYTEVPKRVCLPYVEGCKVLSVAPRLSIASFRVSLEAALNDVGYSRGERLHTKIKAFVSDPKRQIPQILVEHLDAIRRQGNIASHDAEEFLSDRIDASKEHAELCKEIIELLFDHLYEQPARLGRLTLGTPRREE